MSNSFGTDNEQLLQLYCLERNLKKLLQMNQYHIHVRGLVQGVGFRPYVYRLANEMGLRGYVDNSNDGVLIVLQSTCIQKEKFLKALIKSVPEVASIEHIETVQCRVSKKYESFDIERPETPVASHGVSLYQLYALRASFFHYRKITLR